MRTWDGLGGVLRGSGGESVTHVDNISKRTATTWASIFYCKNAACMGDSRLVVFRRISEKLNHPFYVVFLNENVRGRNHCTILLWILFLTRARYIVGRIRPWSWRTLKVRSCISSKSNIKKSNTQKIKTPNKQKIKNLKSNNPKIENKTSKPTQTQQNKI